MRLTSALVLAGLLAVPAVAVADVTHVIGRGHTIETIANRYHVTQKAILDANKGKDPKKLKPGDTLIIPGVNPPGQNKKPNAPASGPQQPQQKPGAHAPTPPPVQAAHGTPPAPPQPRGHDRYEAQPKQPNVVHFVRAGEEFHIRVKDARGKIPPPALKSFEKMMGAGPASRAIDPRLIALLGVVSNHFGGRKLEVISGFRPYTPSQYTQHSNHNFGRAIDFRVQGVPNDVVRDFCRTLRNVGVGYYPASTFIHLDVRDAPAFWTDYSRPGEPPRYDRPNTNADEGTSDVPEEAHSGESPGMNAPPPPPPGGGSQNTPPPKNEAGR